MNTLRLTTLIAMLAIGFTFTTGCQNTDKARAKQAEKKVTYDKAGFFTKVDDDGRLWVFREGSAAHQQFVEHGEPAKIVTRPGGGPGGITIRSVDAETIDAYMGK